MGIQIDISVNERHWISFFKQLYDIITEFIIIGRQNEIIKDNEHLTVWTDIPIASLGGKQILHVPLLTKNWETVKESIKDALIKQFNTKNDYIPYFLRKNPLISYRIEGILNVKLDDQQFHPVPFDIVSTARMRYIQSHLFFRTYTYFDYEFNDIFQGDKTYQIQNHTILMKMVDHLANKFPQISRINVGDPSEDAYKIILYNRHIYFRSSKSFISALFKSASSLLKEYSSENPELPGGLTEKDLITLAIDTKPLNKDYVTSIIEKHKTYQVYFPKMLEKQGVTLTHGSINLRHDKYELLENQLGQFMKGIAEALREVIDPKEKFERKFSEKLDTIDLFGFIREPEEEEKKEKGKAEDVQELKELEKLQNNKLAKYL